MVSLPKTLAKMKSKLISVSFGDWGNVAKSQQDHAGTVGGGEPDVDYTYTAIGEGNATNLRLTSVEYPTGRDIYYNYFNDSDDDDEAIHNRLNRIRSIASAATLTNGTALSDGEKS